MHITRRAAVALCAATLAGIAAPPVHASQEKWTGPDKTIHFAAMGWAPAFAVTLQTGRPLYGFATGVAIGALKEAIDKGTGNGTASGKDFIVTALGAALGAYTGKWALSYQQQTTTVSYATSF